MRERNSQSAEKKVSRPLPGNKIKRISFHSCP